MIKIRQINVSILSLRSTFSKCSRQISTNNLTKPNVELEETPSSPLTDTFGRFHNYLRISLSERCNLRCQYCMPEEGIELTKSSKLLSTEEVIYLTQIFAKHGVEKVRLTGGEPLLRKDIAEICERISAIDGIKSIGLTTNGITGKRHFQKLSDAGLTHVNISLDTLIPEKFEFVSRRRGHHKVMESIDRALDLPFHSVKVNCVVMKGLNEDEILPFVDFTKDKVSFN
uniref:Radical SAM core domain-containing protein n=1 Tax=Clytia hemisphaerica TaxID=252671 RepID=A0A7M5X260_9CNID